jgi:hypothetical protein
VFAVAAYRCAKIYDPPDAVTLWRLTDDVEEAFDAQWEGWLDVAEDWKSFFESVEALRDFDVVSALKSFSLVGDAEVGAAAKLKAADVAKGILIPGPFDLGRDSIALLALGFGCCARGELIVPYSPTRQA